MSRPIWDPEKALIHNLPHGAKFLLAVSGGVDSSVLLRAASAVSREKRLLVEVAHVDHRLRPCSPLDANFVREQASELGFPFHLRVLTPPASGNLEAWGRKERYQFFSEMLRERNLDFACTAHTADDLAETFLMRLLSNKEIKTISRFDNKRNLLRPFLDLSRKSIEKYAEAENINHREDPTNSDTSRLRNRVRRTLIPVLESEFDARIKEVLSNRAASITEDDEALQVYAANLIAEITDPYGSKEWNRSFRGALAAAPPAVAWRAVEQLFREKLGFNLGRRRAKAALLLFEGERTGIELPGGISLRRSNGGILEFRRK